MRHEFRRDGAQTIERTDWSSSHDECGTVPHETNDAVSGRREPESDAWIQNLIGSRVPAALQNQRSGALEFVFRRL